MHIIITLCKDSFQTHTYVCHYFILLVFSLFWEISTYFIYSFMYRDKEKAMNWFTLDTFSRHMWMARRKQSKVHIVTCFLSLVYVCVCVWLSSRDNIHKTLVTSLLIHSNFLIFFCWQKLIQYFWVCLCLCSLCLLKPTISLMKIDR